MGRGGVWRCKGVCGGCEGVWVCGGCVLGITVKNYENCDYWKM